MEKITYVRVDEVSTEIGCIVENAFITALGDNLPMDFTLEDYNRDEVNDALSLMKKKERKAFIVEAVTLLNVVKTLDVEIDKNLYNFFSYLRDVQEGTKELSK